MRNLKLAFAFLTIIPLKWESTDNLDDLGRAAVWFPVVGLTGGIIIAGLLFLSNALFPHVLSSVITVAAWAFFSGGLHLDGLADCCDGFFCATTPERRLEIMKDSHIGAFGVIGLILYFLCKVSVVVAILQVGGNIFIAIVFSMVIARWMLLLAGRQPLARKTGLGSSFAQGIDNRVILLACIIPLVLMVSGGWLAVIAAMFAHLGAFLLFGVAKRMIGGVTGDVYGLVVEMSELLVLWVYAADFSVFRSLVI